MVDVSILIVCYKSRDLIADCLESVEKFTIGCTYEVLLVDCSNDGTVDFVRSRFPRTRIIENSENLGFGGGNNFLARYATADYILLLNPDVILTDDAISELYRTALEFPQAGAVGGRTRLPNGSRDTGSRQFFPTLFRLAISVFGAAKYLNGALPENATVPGEVETLSGAFMIVRRDVWEELKGFDTSFFMYSEELELCYRIKAHGHSVVMTPRAEIIHLAGSGNGPYSSRSVYWITKSKMHFLRKYWNPVFVVLGGILLWSHAAIRATIAAIGFPILGKDLANRLKTAFFPIMWQPSTWWFGFESPPQVSPPPPSSETVPSTADIKSTGS